MEKSLNAEFTKICTSGDGPVPHRCDEGVVNRKVLPDYTVCVVGQPNGYWHIRWYLCTCVSIRGSNLEQTLRYPQRCQHRLQRIEPDVELRTKFPGRNPPIRADELIGALFISQADSCVVSRTVACLSHQCCHCCNVPPIASLCSNSLFGPRKRSTRVDKCQRVHIFPAWRNSMTILCFVLTTMSDAILLDCSSATIYRAVTKLTNCSTSTVILLASTSEAVVQHNKLHITSGAHIYSKMAIVA
jgi:hypothetical protein